MQNFVQAYEKRFGAKPDALAALGYDAAQCLAAALRQIATEDPAQFARLAGPVPSDAAAREERAQARSRLRAVLAATHELRGVTGSITMDEHRNAVKPAVVLAVSQEGYRYVTTIEP